MNEKWKFFDRHTTNICHHPILQGSAKAKINGEIPINTQMADFPNPLLL
jgi:hypothetical protein